MATNYVIDRIEPLPIGGSAFSASARLKKIAGWQAQGLTRWDSPLSYVSGHQYDMLRGMDFGVPLSQILADVPTGIVSVGGKNWLHMDSKTVLAPPAGEPVLPEIGAFSLVFAYHPMSDTTGNFIIGAPISEYTAAENGPVSGERRLKFAVHNFSAGRSYYRLEMDNGAIITSSGAWPYHHFPDDQPLLFWITYSTALGWRVTVDSKTEDAISKSVAAGSVTTDMVPTMREIQWGGSLFSTGTVIYDAGALGDRLYWNINLDDPAHASLRAEVSAQMTTDWL